MLFIGLKNAVWQVLGRGHAERAGLQVGDMVYAINHKYINTFNHKDAQNAILHTGNTLILNIRRYHYGWSAYVATYLSNLLTYLFV